MRFPFYASMATAAMIFLVGSPSANALLMRNPNADSIQSLPADDKMDAILDRVSKAKGSPVLSDQKSSNNRLRSIASSSLPPLKDRESANKPITNAPKRPVQQR